MSKKIISVALAISFALTMIGPDAVAQTAADLQAQIDALLKTIADLQTQLGTVETPAVACYEFTTNLKLGSKGVGVEELQKVLVAGGYLDLVAAGISAPTQYFGSLTKAAVSKYQVAKGIVAVGTGYVGSLTRAELNKCVVPIPTLLPPEPTPTPTPTETPATTTPVVTTFSAALAVDNPVSATLACNANNAEVLRVKITGGASSTTITGLKFKRFGAGVVGDWTGMYVYADGVRLVTTGRTISSDTHEVEFPVVSVNVPAGTDVILSLKGTLNVCSGTTGGQHYFGLTAVTTAATITGLPINGNVFSVGISQVSTVTAAAGTSPVNPAVGQTVAEIGSLKLTAGNNDVEVKEIILSFTGSLARTAVTNVKLYQESTLLATAATVASNDTLTLTLGTPFAITKGLSRIFSVKADFAGRVGETLTTRIEDANSITATDKLYGLGASISGVTSALSIGTITLQGGTITVVDNGPIASYIGKNLQDAVLTKFAVTSARNVEVRHLAVNLTRTLTSSTLALDTTDIADLRLKDADTGATLMNFTIPTAFWVAGTTVSSQVTSTDIFNLAANVTRNLAITVDIGTDTDGDITNAVVYANLVQDIYAGTGSTEQVYIRDVTTGDYLYTKDIVPSGVTGDNQTVRAAGISSTAASTPVSSNFVKGTNGVESVGAVFTATDASDITIRTIQARVYVSSDTTIADNDTGEVTTPRDVITQVKLYDGTTLLSAKTLSNVNVSSAHDYGLASFDNLTVVVPKGSSKKLVVQADISSSVAAVRYFAVAVLGAGITAYDTDSNLLTISSNVNALTSSVYQTVLTGGSLSMALDAASPVSDIVLAGTTNNLVSKFKFTATNEQFTVNKLQVDLGTAANEGSLTKVTIAWSGGSKEGYLSQSGGTSSIPFTNIGWVIPKDTNAILDVKVDTKAIDQNQTETGRAIRMDLDGRYGFEAVGQSQTVTTTISAATTQGYAMSLRKSKPTITTSAYSATLGIQELNLYQFSVAAVQDAVTLKQLAFDVSVYDINTSISVGSFSFWKGSTQLVVGTDIYIGVTNTVVDSLATTTALGTSMTSTTKTLIVNWLNNKETEIASGETITFTLKGYVAGVDAVGDSISMRLAKEIATQTELTRGYAFRDAAARPLGVYATLDAPVASLIWSDKAKGINHNSTEGSTAGSLDWANGVYPAKLAGSYWTYSK